ncbi:MAG: alpha/beta hydrolase [Cyanobacteria bacterium J055]|nr:MAG: alpha/beta hydrolase [Cyanobacteria bacterium J055]
MYESIPMTIKTQFYTWQDYRCAYEVHHPDNSEIALLTIHPIGVGLSRKFWQRFCQEWYAAGNRNPIYNPDLLGCGDSAMPRAAYSPEDWAKQLQFFIQTVIQKPVILVVQGALFPVAIALANLEPDRVKGVVLSGPPSWSLMTEAGNPLQQKLSWNLLFDSPLGNLFYRYARREKFVRSFSIRQLFGDENDVDAQWLKMLDEGSRNLASRYAVFSFLAGFWRKNYREDLANLKPPIFAVFGEKASGISKTGKTDTAEQRLSDYRNNLSNCDGAIAPGRNVMPYEATAEFVKVISPFVRNR